MKKFLLSLSISLNILGIWCVLDVFLRCRYVFMNASVVNDNLDPATRTMIQPLMHTPFCDVSTLVENQDGFLVSYAMATDKLDTYVYAVSNMVFLLTAKAHASFACDEEWKCTNICLFVESKHKTETYKLDLLKH